MSTTSRIVRLIAAGAASMVLAAGASAQEWPPAGKPVTFIVPYAPGNITDIAARMVAKKLSEALGGKPFLVENRTGAASQIATDYVAKAAPDGSTFLVEGPAFATNQSLYRGRLPYDAERDFVPVALLVENALVLVTAASKPYQNVRDLIAYAKAHPGRVTMGSGGNGVLSHMAQALTAVKANVDIVHVPYRGGSPAQVDTVAGQIDSMWNNPSSAMPLIKSGRLRPLAVSSKTRSPALPDVPTFAEQGYPDFEAVNWFGMFAPSGLPPHVLKTVHAEVMKVLAQDDVKERFASDGVQVGTLTQGQFAAFVKAETVKWGEIIRENKIKAD